jgi:hypothetical protein
VQLEGNGAGSLSRLGHVRLVSLLGNLMFVDALSVGVFGAVLAEHVSLFLRGGGACEGC